MKVDLDVKKTELKVAIGALIVSIIAIIFSQIRPLHELFEKPDLSLAVTPTVEAGHTIGHVSLTRYVTFSNTGHRAGTVVRTQLFVVRLDADGFEKVFPAAYVSMQPPQFFANPYSVQVPWHPVTVPPDSDATEYVSYSQPWSVPESTESGGLVNQAASELPPTNTGTGQTIKEETFKALEAFVNKNLGGFGTGEFGVLTYFWSKDAKDPRDPTIAKCDVITIVDSQMKTLRDNVNRYHTGVGLVYPNGAPIPTILVNTRDCDNQTEDKMKKRLEGHKPLY